MVGQLYDVGLKAIVDEDNERLPTHVTEDAEVRVGLFDEVAQGIEVANVEKDDHNYAPIGWRRSSNRYTLTWRAVDLYVARIYDEMMSQVRKS